MISRSVLALFLTSSFLANIFGQSPVTVTKPQQAKADDDDVVRITSNLVQVDVTVTDNDGRQVTDLKPEDFEVREENKLQKITNFSYIPVYPATAREVASVGMLRDAVRTESQPQALRLSPSQVRRTMAVLIDDAGEPGHEMSFFSFGAVKETLKKFVAEQIEPNDLVGIFRTRSGNRLLQQFTADRNQLTLAARRLAWIPPGPGGSIDLFAPARRELEKIELARRDAPTNEPKEDKFNRVTRDHVARPEYMRTAYFESNRGGPVVLPVLRFLITDMRKLPGRKTIVLFSDSLHHYPELRLIADYASRSGIVIYTVHAPGLVNPDYIGADEDPQLRETSDIRNSRASFLWHAGTGLDLLAEQTGGAFTYNSNDLGAGLDRALEEQRGYYLVGYRPAEDTFKEGVRGFRKLEVKVKRPGLRVRTRKGFIGVTDDVLAVPAHPSSANSPLYVALASPLPAMDLPVRLTPFFGQDAARNPFLRALLHIDAKSLNGADEPNGWKRLTLDVAAATLGQDGRVVDEFTRTHTVRIPPEALETVRQNGLLYTADVLVKSPGPYQFRIVVRDADSNKFGSATQFIDIPDLQQDRLALSGILLAEAKPDGAQGVPPSAPVDAAFSLVQFSSNPAVRRFRPGMVLSYVHSIYNARLKSTVQKPELTTQVHLFREGQEIFASPETDFDPGSQTDVAQLTNDGLLRLNPTALPGEYLLQITVKDQAVGKKARVATQWIDFEVVK